MGLYANGVCPVCRNEFTEGVAGICRKCYDERRRYGTDGVLLGRSRQCPVCGICFDFTRDTARFCSATCRKRWNRSHPGITPPKGRTNVATIDAKGNIHNHCAD